MIESVPFAIIQINATIITGILILLTITKFVRKTEEFWLPKEVSWIVIPFSVSAILAIWEVLKEYGDNPEGKFIPVSLLVMGIGFIYLIIVIMKISSRNMWKRK